jgi:hypothetical protein
MNRGEGHYLFSMSVQYNGKHQLPSKENNLFQKSLVRHITTKEKVIPNRNERKAAYTFCLAHITLEESSHGGTWNQPQIHGSAPPDLFWQPIKQGAQQRRNHPVSSQKKYDQGIINTHIDPKRIGKC